MGTPLNPLSLVIGDECVYGDVSQSRHLECKIQNTGRLFQCSWLTLWFHAHYELPHSRAGYLYHKAVDSKRKECNHTSYIFC